MNDLLSESDSHSSSVTLSSLIANYFDDRWYRTTYSLDDGIDAFDHYVTTGWRLGFCPGPQFDGPGYLEANPDVRQAGLEPLQHYVEHGRAEGRAAPGRARSLFLRKELKNTNLFDETWYRETYQIEEQHGDSLDHYLSFGWLEGYWPSPNFDGPKYLRSYADVAATNMNPLEHYIYYGRVEGRTLPDVIVRDDVRRKIKASELFDSQWYRKTYELTDQEDPLEHYITIGWRSGLRPSPLFDGAAYLRAHPDIAAAGAEPLLHFIEYGAREGRHSTLYQASDISTERDLPAEIRSVILRSHRDESNAQSFNELLADPLVRFVSAAAAGRDIVEVGFRGVASLELVVSNIAHSARSSRLLVDNRPGVANDRLLRVATRFGLESQVTEYLGRFPASPKRDRWQPIWTENAGSDWIIQSYFYERDLKNKLGHVDLLLAFSSIFHSFEILHVLKRAAYLTENLFIFDIPIVQPFDIDVDRERVRFGPEDIWSASSMTGPQARAMDIYLKGKGIALPQFEALAGAMTKSQVAQVHLDGVWWWFVGLEGLRTLLTISGFQLVDYSETWEGRSIVALASKIK